MGEVFARGGGRGGACVYVVDGGGFAEEGAGDWVVCPCGGVESCPAGGVGCDVSFGASGGDHADESACVVVVEGGGLDGGSVLGGDLAVVVVFVLGGVSVGVCFLDEEAGVWVVFPQGGGVGPGVSVGGSFHVFGLSAGGVVGGDAGGAQGVGEGDGLAAGGVLVGVGEGFSGAEGLVEGGAQGFDGCVGVGGVVDEGVLVEEGAGLLAPGDGGVAVCVPGEGGGVYAGEGPGGEVPGGGGDGGQGGVALVGGFLLGLSPDEGVTEEVGCVLSVYVEGSQGVSCSGFGDDWQGHGSGVPDFRGASLGGVIGVVYRGEFVVV